MLFGATLHATPLLDIYTYLGQEGENAKYFNVGTTRIWAWAIPATIWRAASPKAAPARPTSRPKTRPMSASGGGPIRASSAASASGMQYSYTHLTAFAGTGGNAGTCSPDRRQHGLHQHPLLSVLDFAYV